MQKPNLPEPPAHLKASASQWREIVAAFELEPHDLQVLLVFCEAIDRKEVALARLAAEGLTTTDDRGICRPHPAVAIARDAGTQILRARRELNLNTEPEESRPAAVRRFGRRR